MSSPHRGQTMAYGHNRPVDVPAYRNGWHRAIRTRRRGMIIVGKGDRDAHIDDDWQTTLIAVDRDEHRADAFRQRAADSKHRRRQRRLRLEAFIAG